MKRLEELDAVESCQQLPVRRASHPELGGEIIRGESRQPCDRTIEIIAQLRQHFELRARQRGGK
jgi:hypothetical protein